jgi:hypothetical protein
MPLIIDIYEDFYDLYGGMWGKRHAYYRCKEQSYTVDLLDHVIGDADGEEGKRGDSLLEDLPSDEEENILWEDVVFGE